MSDGELLDAREAMSLLGVNETDLQTMVARGSLRAFRSAGTMKFRRDDVLGLKTEKKTDPTIIMPPATVKTKPGSGILPTVASKTTKRDSSRTLPTVKPASTAATAAAVRQPAKPAPAADASTSSDQIILEEFELAPSEVDPAANTQQVTAENASISGGQTAIDSAVETGGVTVVEPGVNDIDTASATASAIAPVAVPSSGSGRSSATRVGSSRGDAVTAAPALSRVRPAVGGTGMSSVNKRAAATAGVRTAHPIMTFVLILTAGMFLYTSTIIGVQLFKGNYDETTRQRVIPPFLADAPVINYKTTYGNLPGIPADDEGTEKRSEK